MTINGRFVLRLDRLRSKVGESATKKAERVTQQIIDGVIRRSPVLTGSYRASWNVSEGYPEFKDIENRNEANPLGPPTFNVKAKAHFPKFFVTNGRGYALIIENGTYKSAPYGVARVTIASLK